ncbi:MAG: NADPH:quinone reductase-like Zn-dependent oxidoreductase, partial [Myxococcota bacterium]
MRKVVIHKPGSYDQLRLEEHPDPTAGPGEVCVHVDSIGVNYADCIVRMGLYASAQKYVGWPITPGFEVAGRRADTGEPVVAVTRFGGYADTLVVPEHQVLPMPPGFEADQAAAFPTVFMTAWYGLFELANVRAGQRVLVHSAAGGVGGALVQLAKLAGCTVVGVVGGPHKVEVARALGADHVIDKSSTPLWPAAERYAPDGYHIICDANGVETLQQSWKHLCPPGKLVVYGFHTMLPRTGGKPAWLRLAWGWLRTP